MKKTFIATVILLIACSATCFGQFSIGTLSVDKNTFESYIVDCYLHPDTIKLKSMLDNLIFDTANLPLILSYNSQDDANIETFNNNVISNAIKEIVDTEHFQAYYDTLFNNGSSFFNDSCLDCTGYGRYLVSSINKDYRTKAIRSGIKKIELNPAYTYIHHTGVYLVPRKPSEIDFVKYMNRIKQ